MGSFGCCNRSMSGYTAGMRFLIAFPALLLVMSSLALPALAADDEPILAPPTSVHDTPEARETVPASGSDVNLNEEFSSPESGGDGVEVRSFKRKDGATVTEYAIRGDVYMVRVEPGAGMPAYYLYDNDGDGVFERRLPGGNKRISPPQWVIKRF